MKNMIGKIKAKVDKGAIALKVRVDSGKACLQSKTGEGYIDTAVKIIIGVVIGGVLLAGLYTLFNTTVLPTLTGKVTEMFSYSGT